MTSSTSLSRFVLWVMTISTGLCVANLYYCQPLLQQMQESFGVSPQSIGWIPTLTQLGYALGMFFLIPLGDQVERRSLIFISTAVSSLSMIGMALAPNLPTAILMSLIVGVTTMTPQFIIPFAAHLASPGRRGQVVGMIMSGLLLGILLARTVAGFVGAAFGWRLMFAAAAVVLMILAFVLRAVLPVSEPTFDGNYKSLLKSVVRLIRQQPVLREAMVVGSCLFGAFCGFWATLIYLMESPSFNLGARTVGLFGLVGALGALAAPWIGRFADKKSPRTTIALGIFLCALSFVIYWIWGGSSIVALGIGVLLMDVGLQAAHISNQSRVFALVPEARSRLNTAYMFAYFMGGALGSAVASYAWSLYGWSGVCAVALAFILISFLSFLYGQHRHNQTKTRVSSVL
ncbi:MFS transporter [Bdellovibrio sp. HCB337]|uniref:MFS transporter n=1 Tax=Bdellovibrio sp. HCB337 TaxID=3394358 RepID=UPI0039A4CA45